VKTFDEIDPQLRSGLPGPAALATLTSPATSRPKGTQSVFRHSRNNYWREVSMRTMMVGALCAIAMVANANAAVREEPVTYTDAETTMKGFVVYDDAITTKRPGIVMVHEWWGITKHIHNEAHKFAEQGYTAFIADMYGGAKTANNPTDAGALSGSVMKNPMVMESRFNAARDQLAQQVSVDTSASVPLVTASVARSC
jgi:hypothetical protein